MAFNGSVLFELPLVLPTIHTPLQMQGMDKKYNDHVWCKVITTTIRNNFGLSFLFIAWVICSVCKMNVRTLCDLTLIMKSYGTMRAHIF
jgi:hypothetical protein